MPAPSAASATGSTRATGVTSALRQQPVRRQRAGKHVRLAQLVPRGGEHHQRQGADDGAHRDRVGREGRQVHQYASICAGTMPTWVVLWTLGLAPRSNTTSSVFTMSIA